MNFQEAALGYLKAGLCVLPARLKEKRPAVPSWKEFQKQLPSEEEVRRWCESAEAVCVVMGAVSGNAEMLDFDMLGELFDAWCSRVNELCPGLLDRLIIEKSPSGGFHVPYRCETEVCGNLVLAQRRIDTFDDQPVIIAGKTYKPRQDDEGNWHVIVALIETRGEGGQFLCAPSPGYEPVKGDLTQLPVLTAAERECLLEAAWSLNEYVPKPAEPPSSIPQERSSGLRPGDDFNLRGDVRDLLIKYGWIYVKGEENEYWRRPGKRSGWSATLKDRVFYVFSSNAPPFEQNKSYSPFGVYALLEHNGDFAEAATTLRNDGFGDAFEANDVDLSQFKMTSKPKEEAPPPAPKSLGELVRLYPALRPPVIHGLLREGETMNVISAPKIGKSWLVTDLALAIALGLPWLETFPCEPGDVLIIDNELHPETTANRIPRVAAARGIPLERVQDRIYVQNVRGHLKDLYGLGSYFKQFKPGQFKVVILDAFYRFLPMRADENDNGTMANLYNLLDSFAEHLKCCFILIHHTSKGNQSSKDVTDVGAGAGSQSRATDTHVILRKHEEEDAVVLEAAVRSWAPVSPRCLRWAFPVWVPADDLDPTTLKKEGGKQKSVQEDQEPKEKAWNVPDFVEHFIAKTPKSLARLLEETEAEHVSSRRVKRLLELAEEDGLVFPWTYGGRKTVAYALVQQPDEQKQDDRKRAAVEAFIKQSPQADTKDVADQCGVSPRYVQRIRRELEAN